MLAAVGPIAVDRAPRVQHNRAFRHRRLAGAVLVGGRLFRVEQRMRDDPRRTVLLGEVVERSDGRHLDIQLGRKRKKSKHHWSRCSGWAGDPGPMLMICVRCNWKFVAFGPSTDSTAPNTSGCAMNCRLATERASNAPVRLVRRPTKSSRPNGVASMNGCICPSNASTNDSGTNRSMIVAPAVVNAPATSCADASATKRGIEVMGGL